MIKRFFVILLLVGLGAVFLGCWRAIPRTTS